MSPLTRYRLWAATLVWAVTVDPLASVLAAVDDIAASTAMVFVAADALAIALLILTTPPDAIRLPVGRSVRLIGLATAWAFGWSAAGVEGSPSAFVGAALVPLSAVWLAGGFVRRGLTPWWAAVLLWQPAAIGPAALAWPWVGGAAFVLGAALRRPADGPSPHGRQDSEPTPAVLAER